MGDSHYKSEIKGFAGTETISNFASVSAGALTATGAVTGGSLVSSGTYTKIGNKYIIDSDLAYAASVAAVATAIDSSVQGSIILGVGEAWLMVSDTTASRIAMI